MYKLVTIQYEEQASLVVKANTDDEARDAVLKQFSHIPGIAVISVEEAPDDVVEEAMQSAKERTLN